MELVLNACTFAAILLSFYPLLLPCRHVYSWGVALTGRLGHADGTTHGVDRWRPERIRSLERYRIAQVDCGASFLMLLLPATAEDFSNPVSLHGLF